MRRLIISRLNGTIERDHSVVPGSFDFFARHNLASFGATRELAFVSAMNSEGPTLAYFPQLDNSVASFRKNVSLRWRHGLNCIPEEGRQKKDTFVFLLFIILLFLTDDRRERASSCPKFRTSGSRKTKKREPREQQPAPKTAGDSRNTTPQY